MKYNEDINVSGIELLIAVMKRWKMVIGGTLVAAVLSAVVVVFVLGETYSTSGTMLVVRNPLTSGFTPETLSIPSAQPVLMSDDILNQVLERSGIREEKEDLNLRTFRRMVNVETYIEQDTNVEKKYSPLVRLQADAPTPELAKKIVDEWILLASERLNEVLTRDLKMNIDLVSESHDRYFGELSDIQAEIFYYEGQIPIIEEEIEALSKNRNEYVRELQDTVVEIAETEAVVEELAASHAEEKEVIPLRRTITDDALWQTLIQYDSDLPEVLKGALSNEEINPVYTELKSEYITKKATLSGLNQQKRIQESTLTEMDEKIAELNELLKDKKSGLDALEKERYLVEGKFDEYQDNKIQLDIEQILTERLVGEEDGQFRFAKAVTWGVIDPQRVFPQRGLIVMVTAFIAFWVFIGLAFVIELIKKSGFVIDALQEKGSKENGEEEK